VSISSLVFVFDARDFNILYSCHRFELGSDRASDYINALDRAINTKNPQLVMCVVPNNNSARYSAIKKKCIIDKPGKMNT